MRSAMFNNSTLSIDGPTTAWAWKPIDDSGDVASFQVDRTDYIYGSSREFMVDFIREMRCGEGRGVNEVKRREAEDSGKSGEKPHQGPKRFPRSPASPSPFLTSPPPWLG